MCAKKTTTSTPCQFYPLPLQNSTVTCLFTFQHSHMPTDPLTHCALTYLRPRKL